MIRKKKFAIKYPFDNFISDFFLSTYPNHIFYYFHYNSSSKLKDFLYKII